MKKSGKRLVSLPSVRQNNPEICYVTKSIQNAQRGCYSDGRRLHIDSAYGDHNINLFRLRSKRDYIRNMPTAFSNTVKDMLFQLPKTNGQRRLATEHNEQINKIIDTPKEVYLQKIRLQRQQKARKQRQEREKNKYVIGFDEQLRQVNEQLSFQYLPAYEANKWFKIKDNSSSYQPPVFVQAQKQYFTTPKHKPKKRRGYIFQSDSVRRTALINW